MKSHLALVLIACISIPLLVGCSLKPPTNDPSTSTNTITPTATDTSSPTPTSTPSLTPTITPSPTPTITFTPTPSFHCEVVLRCNDNKPSYALALIPTPVTPISDYTCFPSTILTVQPGESVEAQLKLPDGTPVWNDTTIAPDNSCPSWKDDGNKDDGNNGGGTGNSGSQSNDPDCIKNNGKPKKNCDKHPNNP